MGNYSQFLLFFVVLVQPRLYGALSLSQEGLRNGASRKIRIGKATLKGPMPGNENRERGPGTGC